MCAGGFHPFYTGLSKAHLPTATAISAHTFWHIFAHAHTPSFQPTALPSLKRTKHAPRPLSPPPPVAGVQSAPSTNCVFLGMVTADRLKDEQEYSDVGGGAAGGRG